MEASGEKRVISSFSFFPVSYLFSVDVWFLLTRRISSTLKGPPEEIKNVEIGLTGFICHMVDDGDWYQSQTSEGNMQPELEFLIFPINARQQTDLFMKVEISSVLSSLAFMHKYWP